MRGIFAQKFISKLILIKNKLNIKNIPTIIKVFHTEVFESQSL